MTMRTKGDGTRELLIAGGWTLGCGIASALAAKFVLGGIDRFGAHSNAGWLALIIAMMCLPFGLMLALLGTTKWLRNRRLG